MSSCIDERTIGRVHGAKDNDYTAGVICAKVARYAEREHHKDRLLHPLRRKGAKGSGEFERISWDDALDLVAEKFLAAEQRYGAETVWPYYYAGTMGLVMRDGINRLRHAKKYSGFHSTICVNPACDRLCRRRRQSRRRRSARNGEIRSGGDLGHQCGQHAGQRDDACRARAQRTRRQDRGGRHLHERHHGAGRSAGAGEARHRRRARLRGDALPVPRRQGGLGLPRTNTPTRRANWRRTCARAIRNGPPASPARRWRRSRNSPVSIGENKRAFFRLGYGFSRSRNGAANMHAASCIAAVTGAWQLEGGGAFHINADIYQARQDA